MSEETTPTAATNQAPAEPDTVTPAPAEPAAAEPAPTQTTTPPAGAEPPSPAPDRPAPDEVTYVLPDGVPQQVAEFAKQSNMTQVQLDNTLKYFGELIQGDKKQQMDSLRTAGEAHVKNWGEQSTTNLSLARRALAQNDPSGELKAALDSSGFGNHPAVLNFLHTIGKSMQEGGYLKSAVNRPPGQKTAAQAMYGETHPSVE